MIITLLVSCIAIFFAYLASKGVKGGLKFAFGLLTIFIGISYNWTPDYPAYLSFFSDCKTLGIGVLEFDKYNLLKESEYGWVFLMLLFKHIGFAGLFFILTAFENYTVYHFIKKYVPHKWYWFSVFLYTMQTSLMLTCASMMRQWLAICLFMWAVECIKNKKNLYYSLLILAAVSVHRSAIILVPFISMAFVKPFVMKPWHILVVAVSLFAWFSIGPQLFSDNFIALMESDEFSTYSVYSDEIKTQRASYSILGLIDVVVSIYLLPLFSLYYLSRKDTTVIWGVLVTIICIIYPIGTIMVMARRLIAYFSVFGIIAFPLTAEKLSKTKPLLLVGILLIFVLTTFRGYVAFFSPGSWSHCYNTYTTILTLIF